jgi:hypothetical protein
MCMLCLHPPLRSAARFTSGNPSDDGLLHYRPSALVPNDVLPRESLANESDLVWESHCAVNDTSE